MKGFDLLNIREMFFDSSKVQRLIDSKRRKTLSRFGAFVRTRARSSIRKRKKISIPGQPPSSHAGQLKRLLFFAWDFKTNSVVVGPVPFRRGVAPRLLEKGGSALIENKSGKRRSARYSPRPFMAPALRHELPKFVALFKG